jgi:hypothetical protein
MVIVLSSCAYSHRMQHLLGNKMLVYSQESLDSKVVYDSIGHLLLHRGDSLSIVRFPYFSYWDYKHILKVDLKTDSLYHDDSLNASPPYVLSRDGQTISVTYLRAKGYVRRDQYRLNVSESLRVLLPSSICSFENVGVSWFRGDTTIRVAGRKLRVWIFDEYYSFMATNLWRRVFIEKSQLVPVLVYLRGYDDKSLTLTTADGSSKQILRSILPLRNRRFQYRILYDCH